MEESKTERLKRLREERKLFQELLDDFLDTITDQNKISPETIAMFLVDTGIDLCAQAGCPREMLDYNFKFSADLAYLLSSSTVE